MILENECFDMGHLRGVAPAEPALLTEWWGDGLIFAIGYEARSRFVAENFVVRTPHLLGLRFGTNEVRSFPDNLAWCESHESVLVRMADDAQKARVAIRDWLVSLGGTSGTLQIAVDVSSLSRLLIAAVIAEFLQSSLSIEATFIYGPAKFVPPSQDVGPIVGFGAVLDEFGGITSDDARNRLAAVIGLGYEPELALATQQLLDPAETWLLVPHGYGSEYDKAVEGSNEEVIRIANQSVLRYEVPRPFDTFLRLESLVEGLRRDSNVVLVPLGPKILAVVMMLVALTHSPEVSLWRVSAETVGEIEDREPAGVVTGVRAQFAGD